MTHQWITTAASYTVTRDGDHYTYTDNDTGACYHIYTRVDICGKDAELTTFCNGRVVTCLSYRIGERGVLRYNELRREQVKPIALMYGEGDVKRQNRSA